MAPSSCSSQGTDPKPFIAMTVTVTDGKRIRSFEGVKAGNIILSRTFPYKFAGSLELDDRGSLDGDSIYHVVRVIKNEESGTTTDLVLEPLQPLTCLPTADTPPSYQIDGEKVILVAFSPADTTAPLSTFKQIFNGTQPGHFVACTVNPSVYQIRSHLWNAGCPVGCNQGWLPNKATLDRVMDTDEVPAVADFRPLCPVCIGSKIVKIQIMMRDQLDRGFHPHPRAMDFFKRFATAVEREMRRCGYGGPHSCYCTFCLFPLSCYPRPRSHDEAVQSYYAHLEYEATTEVVKKPANTAAVAALPRMYYDETGSKEAKCTICQEDFERSTEVVQLPCGHVICEQSCIDWLNHQDSCPVCRCKIPAADETASSDDGDNDGDAVAGGEWVSSSGDGWGWDDQLSEESGAGNPAAAGHAAGSTGESDEGYGAEGSDAGEGDEMHLRIGFANPPAPAGSEHWDELDWAGWEDEQRMLRRRGSMGGDEELEWAPLGFYD